MSTRSNLWSLLVLALVLLLPSCREAPDLRADAGRDFQISIGESPTFDGCASSGAIINYRWSILEAPEGMAGDAGKVLREVDAGCSFTLESTMGLDEVGTWLIELEVSDSSGRTSSDRVQVIVEP